MKAVPSTVHLMMKFLTKHEIGFIWGDQEVALLCYNATLKEPSLREALIVAVEVQDEPTFRQGEPIEELEDEMIEAPDRSVKIGSQLTTRVKKELICFLPRNWDIFAWSHEDMPSVDLMVMTHLLAATGQEHIIWKPPREEGSLIRGMRRI